MKMRHNLCTLFYQDQVMSPDDSFESIGPALGDTSTIIIPWHGAITVGSSIARAAALHATLEDMAKLDASGDTAATAISAHPYPANLSGSPSTT
jgi:ribulose-5-phosphate 4-epimerase/fuculose-1-phosphate aldolase